MKADRRDDFISRLQRATVRRRVISILATGPVALAGFGYATDAKKRRKRKKKRCGRLQARCGSDEDCCPGKTGRVCASNDKDVQCRGGGNVCCLPVETFGCSDFCDCCGGNTGCVAGQCKVVF